MRAPDPSWRLGIWTRKRTAVLDLLVVGALAAVALLALRSADGVVEQVAVFVSILACLGIPMRHRFPVLALAFSTMAGVVATLMSDEGVPDLQLAIVAGGVTAAGRRQLGIAGATCAAISLSLALLVRGGDGGFEIPAVPLVLALAVATGLAVDYRRRSIDAIVDRARQAEETRDAEARRAVAEERVRIARELHDVVAHHVAVVGVQAGTAEHLVDLDPAAAKVAIAQVRESSSTVLRELATLLNLLRGSEDGARVPAPSLARMDDLVGSFRRGGLQVDVALDGVPRPLAPVVDMAGYRVVQESLTNVHKHGAGTAHLRLAYQAASIVIDVRNPVGTPRGHGDGGYGLIGMRERVATVGGTLSAGMSDGQYVVRAELPAPAITAAERSAGPVA